MKNIRRIAALVLALVLMLTIFSSCSGEEESEAAGGNTAEIAGDYYLDLSELGMKLVIYLRISDDGTFMFSNTTAFEVNKSSGTVQKGTDSYLMSYETVNGEEKTMSDGLSSSFTVTDDSNLDFTCCEKVYYGSASAVTTSDENPDAKLIAVPLPEGYEEPDTESDFTTGTYSAEANGIAYTISFYEDLSYLLLMKDTQSDGWYYSETGSYGVSTTQLALTPTDLSRISCEVVSDKELSVSVPAAIGGEDREALSFTKTESSEEIAVLKGTAEADDGEKEVTLTLYSDGSYSVDAGGFTEGGVFVPDTESESFKTYPDHPETSVRGLNQISTVPSGEMSYTDGKLALVEFRVRTSESLTRVKCNLTQE